MFKSDKIRLEPKIESFSESLKVYRRKIKTLMMSHSIETVYEYFERMPPGLKMALRPMLTVTSGLATALGTARATLEALQAVLSGTPTVLSLQIYNHLPLLNRKTCIGVPVTIRKTGLDFNLPFHLPKNEINELQDVATQIEAQYFEAVEFCEKHGHMPAA